MKIFDNDKNLKYSNWPLNKNLETDDYKTTNINVLLNRVRLDKRKSYIKRIIFLVLLTLIIAALFFLIF
tara:strand:- start:256 stop:462 length:207 start_codon:yes stop_codon:yes gene_type:complete